MSTLLLRLAGPMQSWGAESKFDVRRTGREPSKSGVLGLVAAALGIRRQDTAALGELAQLHFGVRVDREGTLLRDFQTARPAKGSPYVTNRYYLADAVFTVGLESEDEALLERIRAAVKAPAFPLYLGRRSCPVIPREMCQDIYPMPLEQALRETAPSGWTRLVLDAEAGESGGLVRDVPVSFDPVRREYAFRLVREVLPDGLPEAGEHDPMAELED